jgi:hypothetical protein
MFAFFSSSRSDGVGTSEIVDIVRRTAHCAPLGGTSEW